MADKVGNEMKVDIKGAMGVVSNTSIAHAVKVLKSEHVHNVNQVGADRRGPYHVGSMPKMSPLGGLRPGKR